MIKYKKNHKFQRTENRLNLFGNIEKKTKKIAHWIRQKRSMNQETFKLIVNIVSTFNVIPSKLLLRRKKEDKRSICQQLYLKLIPLGKSE